MSLPFGPAVAATTINGRNGAGSISLAGAKVGDLVTFIVRADTSALNAGVFEAIISVADEIQQLDASNLSALSYDVVIVRPSI